MSRARQALRRWPIFTGGGRRGGCSRYIRLTELGLSVVMRTTSWMVSMFLSSGAGSAGTGGPASSSGGRKAEQLVPAFVECLPLEPGQRLAVLVLSGLSHPDHVALAGLTEAVAQPQVPFVVLGHALKVVSNPLRPLQCVARLGACLRLRWVCGCAAPRSCHAAGIRLIWPMTARGWKGFKKPSFAPFCGMTAVRRKKSAAMLRCRCAYNALILLDILLVEPSGIEPLTS